MWFDFVMEDLFFELIQISIGNKQSLTHIPTGDEWQWLYNMSRKQTLTGVCFRGVDYLCQNKPEQTANLPDSLKLHWIASAMNIRQRNVKLNKCCRELQTALFDAGFANCILKGQGVAALYLSYSVEASESDIPLSLLRQPGDIDLWVAGGMNRAYRYCIERFHNVEFDYVNAHAPFYSDVEVELHWRAMAEPNLFLNRKMQKWLSSEQVYRMMLSGKVELVTGEELIVPVLEFNAFYMMFHCYHHMFESGLGLRQLMDYYFLLLSVSEPSEGVKENTVSLFREFDMMRFASAVMWIMKYVFGLNERYLLCPADEKEGRFILNEVMSGGNFGHHDRRIRKVGYGKLQFLLSNLQHNWGLAKHYPKEFFWNPIWLVWHWIWKRSFMMRNKQCSLQF